MTYMNSQEANVDTIGTESNTEINKNQSGGGFLSFLFDSDNNKLVTKAFYEDNINAVIFLLENKFKIDCCYVDDNNKNVLHYMIQYADYNEIIGSKLIEILESGVHESCVNHQDCDGNTPLHVAVQTNNDAIVVLLEKNGADKTIKNNNGDYVEEICENDEQPSEQSNVNFKTNIFIKTERKDGDTLGNMMKLFNAGRDNEIPTETIGFNRQDAENEDTILTFDVHDNPAVNPVVQNRPVLSDLNTLDYTNQNQPSVKSVDVSNVGSNVGSDNEAPVSLDTDIFINDIFTRLKRENPQQTPQQYQQMGGKKSRKNTFNRKITTYSDVNLYSDTNLSEGGNLSSSNMSSSNYDFESSISDLSEYAKEKNQKSVIHQEAIEKIMKLLKTDDEKLAKSYKAILYKRVKEENPDASGLDRATKMSKLVKKTELNKISQEEIDPIYQYLIEKAENPESEKKNKKSKKKKSKKAESTESDSESLASGESTISENMTEQAYLTLASDLSQY
jgi:hypothetical protein